jgi:hypothetical protein
MTSSHISGAFSKCEGIIGWPPKGISFVKDLLQIIKKVREE